MNKKKLDIIKVHIYISGKVQGVSYRWWFKKEATRKKLVGWVRNRTSNRVEAEIIGKKTSINEMIKDCKNGPPLAVVDNVIVKEINESKKLKISTNYLSLNLITRRVVLSVFPTLPKSAPK